MMTSIQSRYKLLNATNLKQRPYLSWLVKDLLPAKGLAVIYGPSGSGKSFLSLDLAASIAEGKSWFGRRVNSAPVIYLALEGEDGIRQRTEAWVQHNGVPLPNDLQFILQPFKLSDEKDVDELAKVLPKGCVLIIDTLSKASSTSDENTSHDMGVLTDAAKRLQVLTEGLVLLIHHTGKNESAGMRGHSSLSATIDASIQVSRQGSLCLTTITVAG